MEKKFKKGDTVRRIKDDWHGVMVGDVVIVDSDDGQGGITITKDGFCYLNSCFELVKRYEFKVGDTIRIVRTKEGFTHYSEYMNRIVHITEVISNYYNTDDTGDIHWFDEEIELIEEAKAMNSKTISFDEIREKNACETGIKEWFAKYGLHPIPAKEISLSIPCMAWLKGHFSDRFEDEWTDITGEISAKLMPMNSGSAYQVKIIHGHKDIGFFTTDGFMHIQWSHRKNYKFETPSMGSFVIFHKE